MKDEKLKLELANIICSEKFNTKKLQKIWKLIIQARKEIIDIGESDLFLYYTNWRLQPKTIGTPQQEIFIDFVKYILKELKKKNLGD